MYVVGQVGSNIDPEDFSKQPEERKESSIHSSSRPLMDTSVQLQAPGNLTVVLSE
jgi:hypothetical protein